MVRKILIFLVTFVLAGCGPLQASSPTPTTELDEALVYMAALKDLYGASAYVFMENTSTDPGGTGNISQTLDYVLENLHGVDAGTVESFRSRNEASYQLDPKMDLGSPYSLLTQDQRNSIFGQNQSGWEVFYQNYPDAPGITSVSRIGFNAAHDQALLYAGTQSNFLAGAGFYLLLTKVDGSWKVDQKVMTWIS